MDKEKVKIFGVFYMIKNDSSKHPRIRECSTLGEAQRFAKYKVLRSQDRMFRNITKYSYEKQIHTIAGRKEEVLYCTEIKIIRGKMNG